MRTLGLSLSPSSNPGRLRIDKRSIEEWFSRQRADDVEKRRSGKAHGNLFLAVANAISRPGKGVDVRAVCPFSAAQIDGRGGSEGMLSPAVEALVDADESAAAGVLVGAGVRSETGAGVPAATKGRCPSHAKPGAAALVAAVAEGAGLEVTKVGGCPAHAAAK